jgi:hypothetical protein
MYVRSFCWLASFSFPFSSLAKFFGNCLPYFTVCCFYRVNFHSRPTGECKIKVR